MERELLAWAAAGLALRANFPGQASPQKKKKAHPARTRLLPGPSGVQCQALN